MLVIYDTEVFPLDLQKIQSGEPCEFKKLYRRFYDTLVDETTLLLNSSDQALALVQLSCIQSWIHCEGITSEQYYFGYTRARILRYARALSQQEPRIQHELEILKEILSDRYALTGQQLANLYGHFTLSQKALIRQIFKSYFQSQPGNPPSVKHPHLLRYAFYIVHCILT